MLRIYIKMHIASMDSGQLKIYASGTRWGTQRKKRIDLEGEGSSRRLGTWKRTNEMQEEKILKKKKSLLSCCFRLQVIFPLCRLFFFSSRMLSYNLERFRFSRSLPLYSKVLNSKSMVLLLYYWAFCLFSYVFLFFHGRRSLFQCVSVFFKGCVSLFLNLNSKLQHSLVNANIIALCPPQDHYIPYFLNLII